MDTPSTNVQKLIKQHYTPQQHILTLSSNNVDSKNKKLILTLTQILMYEIWISRNILKYDKIQHTQQTIITKITTQLKNILNAHYKLHKPNDTLIQFQQLFCINNAIAKTHNGKLQINISTTNSVN